MQNGIAEFLNYNQHKLATPPGAGVNPPAGSVFMWHTLDGSNNLVINYRLPDGTNKTFTAGGGSGLTENTTVNLNSSMTATQIQALIDVQPKNLNGYTLTFQFADGTYSTDQTLSFNYFTNGNLNIYGNSSDNSVLNSKSVSITAGTGLGAAFEFIGNACKININYIEISFPNESGYTALKFLYDCSSTIVEYCHFSCSGQSETRGLLCNYCGGLIYSIHNYFSGLKEAVSCAWCASRAFNTDSEGSSVLFSAVAVVGAVIVVNNNTNLGSTYSNSGGTIVSW